MADFLNGLESASDYINNTSVGIPTNITGDLGTGVISAQMQSFTLKELVCGILAGNGLKLPNIQICLKINLANLFPMIPAALDAIKGAFAAAMAALDEFIAHTGIDAVLNRLNGVIADFAAIANMINFCGTPVIPRPIPNVLSDMMGSFTGAGMNILNGLGEIAESDIGGCISTQGGVNFGIFKGGAIKEIGDLIEGIRTGTVGEFEARIASINNQLNGFANDIKNLIEFENNYSNKTVEPQPRSKGGSVFAPVSRVHTGVGVQVPQDVSFSDATRLAGNIQSTYNQLSQYVIDDQGNNIFDYLLEPELIDKLKENIEPSPVVTEQQPVYDYCGKIIGYTTSVISGDTESSSGSPIQSNFQPGYTNVGEEVQEASTIAELRAEIEILKNEIANISSGSPSTPGSVDTSNFYTKEEVNVLISQAVANVMSSYATTSYVDNAVSNVSVDMSSYATINYVNSQNHFSGNYNDLINKPVIPQPVDLTGYATELYVRAYVTAAINNIDMSVANTIIPSGTTLDRTLTPTVGELWFNTDLGMFEGYNGSEWKVLVPATVGPGTITGTGGSINMATYVDTGTTAERPVDAAPGQLWYNTDINMFEGYDGTEWKVFIPAIYEE